MKLTKPPHPKCPACGHDSIKYDARTNQYICMKCYEWWYKEDQKMKLTKKQYYIYEVSKILGMPSAHIRWLCNTYNIPGRKRTPNSPRKYTPRQIEQIKIYAAYDNRHKADLVQEIVKLKQNKQ